jgi:hypothetical protein
MVDRSKENWQKPEVRCRETAMAEQRDRDHGANAPTCAKWNLNERVENVAREERYSQTNLKG